MRNKIVLLLSICIFAKLSGQVIKDQVTIKEPKATDFIKFGNNAVSEYTRSLKLSLPYI